MRAAVYHGQRDVRVEDVPAPEPPGPDEVRLRVVRGALCGTDASEFAYGPFMVPLGARHPASGHQGPTIIGHEFVGEIEEVGSAVEGLALGERVVPGAGRWCGTCKWCLAGRPNLCASYYTLGLNANGGMTELINVPALMCRPVPDACGDDAAAMAQPLAVALHAVNRARVSSGDIVVLIGVGGIGLFVLAGLVARGAHIVALDIEEERLASARRFGAAHALDARRDDLAEMIDELLGGAPIDVVVEASGAPPSPALAQRLVARGGRILLVGLQKAPREMDLADLVLREVEILTTVAHICDHDLPEAIELLTTTDLSDGALDRVITLEAIVDEGLIPLAEGAVGGKVLVTPDGRT
jgi:(R,R)-butanediol dehydrogenase / meso-butanediol dehydrogenase / diacetyl reductase